MEVDFFTFRKMNIRCELPNFLTFTMSNYVSISSGHERYVISTSRSIPTNFSCSVGP